MLSDVIFSIIFKKPWSDCYLKIEIIFFFLTHSLNGFLQFYILVFSAGGRDVELVKPGGVRLEKGAALSMEVNF